MNSARADAHFGSQTEPIAIGETRTDVVKDAGAVDLAEKRFGRLF